MDHIRWGIIGCGDVCEIKSGPAFSICDGSTLTAVMRRDAAKAADYAKRHEVPRWTTNAAEIIHADDVDVVYIATPPSGHEEYALRVAAAGKPCYVEKPMARSAAECERMNAAFANAGKPLFVAYYRRRLPRFLKAKELIDRGRLGKVTSCHYRLTRHYWPAPPEQWRLAVKQSGGGLFLDLGSHTLDILDFLLGPFVEYGGSASTTGATSVEDAVAVHFRTAGGVIGTGSWNFAGSLMEDKIEIVGTEGRLKLSTFGNDPVRLERDEESQEDSASAETYDLPNPPHIQQPLIQTVVDQLLGRGMCPSTGETAIRSQRVMDAALVSYYGARTDEFWNREATWPGRTRR